MAVTRVAHAPDAVFPAPSLRRRMTRLLSAQPSLFIPAYRCFGSKRQLVIRRDTQIVIEGFPRSANSFAVIAFETVQDRPVRIAHHLHAAAQVLAAARRQLPCIVLVRDPWDAIASLLVRERDLSPLQAIEEYVTFYRAAGTVRSECVVGRFETVTKHYERVIREVNARFGTSFREFVNDDADIQAVFAAVERAEAVQIGAAPGIERVAHPVAERRELLAQVRTHLRTGAPAREMARAVRAYEDFVAAAPGMESA